MKKAMLWIFIVMLVVSMVLTFSLVGCKEEKVEETTAEETTAAEEITLHMWDTWSDESQNAGMDEMVGKFQEINPNIEIVREVYRSTDLETLLPTALASDTGPDIMYYDSGPGYAGILAKAGLLLDLDEAYEENGWNDRIFDFTKKSVTFDGKACGIGNELEFIGVYYNKTIFDELGVTEPETYEEFIQICEKAKAAGYTPIAFADGGDGNPAEHQFSIMANNIAGKEKIEEVLFGEGTWDDPDFVKAIQLFFVDMNEAGYFLPDTTVITAEEGNAIFYSGQAAMDMTGSWMISELNDAVEDFEVGFFAFPSIEGKPVLPPGGLGSGYFISSKTAYPEEAIKFLDYLFTKESAEMMLESMSIIVPVAMDTEGVDISPLMRLAVDIVSNVTLGYNIDVLAGNRFNQVQIDGFQAILLGQKTPEEQIKDLQVAWEADKSE